MNTLHVPQLQRILIADDHAIVREGLKRILEDAFDGVVLVEVGGGLQALEQLRMQSFDLAIFDLSMPDMGGLDLLQRARSQYPDLPILILTMHVEEQYAMRAFKAGAKGYITKDSVTLELAQAVRKVAQGGIYVGDLLAERMVQHLSGAVVPPPHAQLSNRELEVLRRLLSGQRPGEIAKALHLSIKTISSHKSRMQHKLQLPSTSALIRYGIEHGLGENDPLPSTRD